MEKIETESGQYLIEEVKIIQDVIKRMSSNSFLIKGWSITVFSAVLLFTGSNKKLLLFAIVPILLFWFLDSYFLRQEKLFRESYNWVITHRLQTNDYLFDLSTERFEQKVDKLFHIFFSRNLIIFYTSMLLVIISIYLLNHYNIIA